MHKGLRERYQFYKKTGKLPYKNGRIDEELMYRERMKDVARENYEQWGYENPEDAWQDAVNDPTYDYRGYYSDPQFQNTDANSEKHWPDKYKTPQHETFSSESKYHGKVSDKNPYGLRGGMWIGDKFIPATWQNPIQIPHYEVGNLDEADVFLSPYENVVYKPNQIKTAEAVTHDNNGVRIPLGERDNFKLGDIRYSWLAPFIGLGTLGSGMWIGDRFTGLSAPKLLNNEQNKQ